MFSSTLLSQLSRLVLLSVFCTGLFITSGELSVTDNGVHVESSATYGISTVHAAGDGSGSIANTTQPGDATINSIISFLNLGIGILTFLITPLIMLAGWLLSPDWTFGEIFGLRPILHQLWILISNVVYVIFGFMLVFVAFANIFGGEHSKAYEMKTMLPKLVTGMLMVPFTWFIVSAVLSVSNVLTASVISLPMETILKSGGNTAGLLTDKIIPKNIIFNKDVDLGKNAGAKEGESTTEGGNTTGSLTMNGNFATSNCPGDGKNTDCLSIKEFLTNGGGGAYNLLSVYAYGIFRIQEYKSITLEQKINKVIDIASKLGFGVIFFVVFGILVIAIVYALFSRAVMLWLYAMFSPFFALTFVLGDKAKKLEKFTIHEFISLALVPVYVSAALAFGLMFLGLVMGASGEKADGTLKGVVDIQTEAGSATTTFKFGEVTLTTIGLLDPEVKNGASKALDIGKGIIGTIIMNVLALVILWMAVMAALGASKITEAAVAPIKGFGDEIGKLAMKAPQYVPIPLPGKDASGKQNSISMAGLNSAGSAISGKFASDASNRGNAFGQSIVGGGNPEATKAANKVLEALKSKGSTSAQAEGLKELIVAHKGDAAKMYGDTRTRESLAEFQKWYEQNGGKHKEEVKKLNISQPNDLAKLFAYADEHFEEKQVGVDILKKRTRGSSIGNYNQDLLKSEYDAKATTPGSIEITNKTATNITVNGHSATIAPVTPLVAGATLAADAKMTITRAGFDKLVQESGAKADELEKELKKQHVEIHG